MKKTAFVITIFISSAFFLSMFNLSPLVAQQASSAKTTATADCLEYGPTVQLTGNLVRRTFPGPPNFESVAQGDAPELSWILHLDKPICVKARAGDDFDVKVSHLTDLQLVLETNTYYQRAKELLL